jgi:hypothetical protein
LRRGRKRKLGARVFFSGGLPPREVISPFQGPTFRAIAVALHDLTSDGIADSLLFTARRGKKVNRIVSL